MYSFMTGMTAAQWLEVLDDLEDFPPELTWFRDHLRETSPTAEVCITVDDQLP